jgi:hypothetical protein
MTIDQFQNKLGSGVSVLLFDDPVRKYQQENGSIGGWPHGTWFF